MKIFDTHTHYDDVKFDSRFDGDRVAFINHLINEEGVLGAVGVGVDIPSSAAQIDYAQRIPTFYAACGFHPANVPLDSDADEEMERLSLLINKPKVVAIGEIGLDYYWEKNPPREIQKLWFEKQLELSLKKDLPVIIHDREAHGDTLDVICRYKETRGVFHCYSGSLEMARELVKRDYMVSFTGVVTFKNATRVEQVVAGIPMEYIMLETDCPYLAPVPMRSKVNHSGYLIHTAQKIGEIKGIDTQEVIEICNANAARFFGITL